MDKIIIEKADQNRIEELNINSWPIWTKEVSIFDWYYDDMEECLILEGEVDVYDGDKKYTIKKGDFVTFEKGLSCKWDVKKPIKKHYNFR